MSDNKDKKVFAAPIIVDPGATASRLNSLQPSSLEENMLMMEAAENHAAARALSRLAATRESRDGSEAALEGVIDSLLEHTNADKCVFKRDGRFWKIRFDCKEQTVQDCKGLADIHYLLSRGEALTSIYDLPGNQPTKPASTVKESDSSELGAINKGSTALKDNEKDTRNQRVKLLQVIVQYQKDLKAANESLDPKDLAQREEIERSLNITQNEYNSLYDKNGKERRLGNETTKVVQSTQKRVARVLNRFREKENLPQLANHLESLEIGEFCQYKPGVKIDWNL